MNKDTIKPSEVSDVLLAELQGIDLEAQYAEVGTTLQVSDGVVRIYGLRNAEANELLEFENGIKAVVMNLEEDNVGAVLLGPTDLIKEGDLVRRTGHTASIQVSEALLGRVITPLGDPLDGKGPIGGETVEMPLERKAPGVIFRQPVSEPLQTGLKAVDAMIPIGRGQRELIIGDRQTGKTAIAVDTIINQRRNFEAGDPVYCIYVAVGQKASTVASLVETLRRHGAMEYTIVVAATASDPAAMQYFAPFAGAAIGEFFRDTGRHALVVYDDLSKQAVAYREVSLILRRPSGREAYPGDIFSMLAEDFEPNRLERTKYAIGKLFDGLKQDRVGLIVFAGEPKVQLPITSDYRMARAFARRIDPSLVSVQGTAVGKALEQALLSFSGDTEQPHGRVVILITDGENHEDDALAVAERAAKQGIRIYTIGIGTPEGAPIQIDGEFIKDEQGEMVVSKLNEQMLAQIAETTGGAYVRATKQDIGLDEIVKEINSMEQAELSTLRFEEFNEQYQYLLIAALVLLLVEFLLLPRRNPLLAHLNIFREKR